MQIMFTATNGHAKAMGGGVGTENVLITPGDKITYLYK